MTPGTDVSDIADRLSSPRQRADGSSPEWGERCWRCIRIQAGHSIGLCDDCYEELRS